MTDRKLVYTRSYDIQLTIRDIDYSLDIYKVRIISSIFAPYTIVMLDIFVDPHDIILDAIFGQDPLKLSIRLLGEDASGPLESVDFELMYVHSNYEMVHRTRMTTNQSQPERSPVSFITVTRDPFVSMMSTVYGIYNNVTVEDILIDLVTQYTDADLVLDEKNINKNKIDQLIVPTTTLYRAIKYIDEEFGIFDGLTNYGGFCQYNNEIQIMNLTARMSMNQIFTLYRLTEDGTDNQDIFDKCMDGKNFYTYSPYKNEFSGNAKFAKTAKNVRHILKPKDTLYRIEENDLNTATQTYGLMSKKVDIPYDDSLDSREQYITDTMGYGDSNTMVNSYLAQQVAGLSTLRFTLERNLPILRLIQVGEPVKFVPNIVETTDISGKYILKSSDLNFNRTQEWEATAVINLMRSNKTI